jgi:hypothetical protein
MGRDENNLTVLLRALLLFIDYLIPHSDLPCRNTQRIEKHGKFHIFQGDLFIIRQEIILLPIGFFAYFFPAGSKTDFRQISFPPPACGPGIACQWRHDGFQ